MYSNFRQVSNLSYIIGSLNTHHFTGIGKHDVSKIADIILKERFDIVALQEVRRREAIELLISRLPGWAGEHGEDKSSGLGFGFLWNTKRVRECSKDKTPEILTSYHSSTQLHRNPFYGRFTPNGLIGGAFFEIRLINVHIHHGGSDNIQNIEQRMAEFKTISNDIYKYLSSHRYGNNMPAYTIVLGDYNLCSWQCLQEEFLNNENSAKTHQAEKTTLRRAEAGFSNDYDHFGYDENRFIGTNIFYERVDTVNKYMNNDFQLHMEKVSDHVPIKLELVLNPRL